MNQTLKGLLCFSISLILLLGSALYANAAELNTNLLANPGGEGTNDNGKLTSNYWSGSDLGYSNKSVNDFSTFIEIEKKYNGNDITSVLSIVPHSGEYYMGFATTVSASVGEGTHSCFQDIDISGNAADIDNNAMVFNLSGWLSATGGNIAKISVEELDENKNVVSTPVYEKSTTEETWTQVTLSGAVASNVRYLRVIITGTYSACGLAAFDDLSLTISPNISSLPVISSIPDQRMVSGETLGPIRFSVSDDDTNFADLLISVASSNTSLIPNSNISASLSDGHGELSLTAVSGKEGQSTVTVSISDGTKTAVTRFSVTVNSDVQMDTNLIVNGVGNSLNGWTDPSGRFYISGGAFTHVYNSPYFMYQTTNVSKFSEMIDAGFLTYTTSCNLTNGGAINVIFTDSFGNKISSGSVGSGLIPTGTRIIRVEVGGTSGCKISNVNLMINSAGLPKMTPIGDQTINDSTGDIPFTIGYAGESVTLSATSSDTTFVPDSQIIFHGSGYQRTVCVTPADVEPGSSRITIFANGTEVTSFIVKKIPSVENISVSAEDNATSVLKGGTLQMAAAVTPSSATEKGVTWSVMNGTGSATINDTGLLTAVGAGTVTVKAVANDGSGVYGTILITINAIPVSDISVSSENTSIFNEETLQMIATVEPANATEKNVIWSTENGTGSATISDTGLLTATGVGTVTVKAAAADESGIYGTLLITIKAIPVSGITVSGAENAKDVLDGGLLRMIAAVEPSNATEKNVIWSAENGTGSATISDTGLLTATGVGTVTVKAAAIDGSGVYGTQIININYAPIKIVEQPKSIALTYGYTNFPTLGVKVQTQPVDSGKTVTYQWYKDGISIDNAINSNYAISPDLDAGIYSYFCAVTCDGYTVNSDAAMVTVNKLTGSIVNKDYETLYTYSGNCIAIPAKNNFLTNSNGVVTFLWYKGDSTQDIDKMNKVPVNAGIYTLKIDLGETDSVTSASTTFRVNISKAEQVPLIISEVTDKKYGYGEFSLSTTGGSGTGEVVYIVSEGNGILSISGNTATIMGAGKVSVTATKAEDDNYNASSATREITIAKAEAPSIVFPTATDITYGQKLSTSILKGGSTEYGHFDWEDSDEVPEVNGGTNTSSAIFTPSVETIKNYEPIDDYYKRNTVTFSVSKATPEVIVTAAISEDDGIRKAVLTATMSKVDNGHIPTGSIKFVDSTSGTAIKILGAEAVPINYDTAIYMYTGIGDQIYKIKAIYSGDNNYETAISSELSFDSRKQDQKSFNLNQIGSKTYGDNSFTLSTTGGDGKGIVSFESSDSSIISIEGSTATIHKAGTVNITAIKAQDLDYNEAKHTASITVAKKAVIVKADDKEVVKGCKFPKFTFTAKGLVNQDSFTLLPEISTIAIDTGTLGEYTINISGGVLKNAENYTVSYVNGKLSIVNSSTNNEKAPSEANESRSKIEASTVSAGKDGNLSKELIDKLVKEEVKEFSIDSEAGTIILDLETLKIIQKQINGDIVVSAKNADKTTLSAEAKKIVGDRPVFEFSIIGTNGTKVTNFGKGKIAVSIPYVLGENEKAENIAAYYINADGDIQEMPNSAYDERIKAVNFVTDHFSKFAVGYKSDITIVFTDIEGHWAKDAIDFVTSRGIFDGTAQDKFSPNMSMTRGMFVTVLGRLAEADVSSYKDSHFTDVSSNAYYMPFIEWASKNGIVRGTSDTYFEPEQAITREQMAVIMANYAKAIGLELPQLQAENSFADNEEISYYAKNAVKQMQMAGLFSGREDNRFDSKGTATRAEVSAVIKRFVEISENK